MDLAYDYRCQNLVIGESGMELRGFVMGSGMHMFLAEYARKFANVEIPIKVTREARLRTFETRKIGKAMLTHEKAKHPLFQASQRPAQPSIRYQPAHHLAQIAQDMKTEISLRETEAIWKMTPLFLFGGNFMIHVSEVSYQSGYGYIGNDNMYMIDW